MAGEEDAGGGGVVDCRRLRNEEEDIERELTDLQRMKLARPEEDVGKRRIRVQGTAGGGWRRRSGRRQVRLPVRTLRSEEEIERELTDYQRMKLARSKEDARKKKIKTAGEEEAGERGGVVDDESGCRCRQRRKKRTSSAS